MLKSLSFKKLIRRRTETSQYTEPLIQPVIPPEPVSTTPRVSLPYDIYPLIIFHSDRSSLISLARTCRYFNKLVKDKIWEHIELLDAQEVKKFVKHIINNPDINFESKIKSIHIHFELLKWDINLNSIKNEIPNFNSQIYPITLFENLEKLIITSSGKQFIDSIGIQSGYENNLKDLIKEWIIFFVGSIYGPKKFIGKHFNKFNNKEIESEVEWSTIILSFTLSNWKNLQSLSLPIIPFTLIQQFDISFFLPKLKSPFNKLKLLEIHSANFENFGRYNGILEQWIIDFAKRKYEYTQSDKSKKESDVMVSSNEQHKHNDENDQRKILFRIRESTETSDSQRVSEWIGRNQYIRETFRN
ncbi:uncharacterized protein I206_107487 [Kwoniella pini CBS 10737]